MERQISILENGGKIAKKHVLYDPNKNETRPMRSKEEANDYRYFPDPDLLPLVVTNSMIQDVRDEDCQNCRSKNVTFHGAICLNAYDATSW